jgi:iron complex transport system permease protein
MRIALAATVLIFLFCLCIRYNAYSFTDKFVPLEYLKSYALAIKLLFSRLFETELWYRRDAAIEAFGSIMYHGSIARLSSTLVAIISGAALSIAGAIFQTAYRNPMASPNILGATAGVGLGNVLVIMLYSAAAVEHIYLRYEFCYGFTALCVILVLALGRLTSNKAENFSILETVILGSVISQGLNVATMYIMYNMQEEDMLLYQEVTLGTYMQTDTVSMLIFFSVMGVTIIPVLLMRYRMNIIGLDKMETTTIGVSSRPMRIIGQLCGVLMVTAAMIHCGDVGMLSLVIPYIVRQTVGADFRKVCVYSALAGGSLLMVCRLLTSFILLLDEPIPVVFIVNLFLMPAFVIILARQRRKVV